MCMTGVLRRICSGMNSDLDEMSQDGAHLRKGAHRVLPDGRLRPKGALILFSHFSSADAQKPDLECGEDIAS